jgi:outer membrane protein OmpA-like peptidoglycan-associated protein|nr:MAG TPA: hypothetical protein [Bacteriophage sp.]
MTQLKLLYYAQESAVRKCHFYNKTANDFKDDAVGKMARKMTSCIMSDIKEIEAMIVDEEERLRTEAEKQREQAAKAQQVQAKAPQAEESQQTQQAQQVQKNPLDYTVNVEYTSGRKVNFHLDDKDMARHAYDSAKTMAKRLPDVISRVSLTQRNSDGSETVLASMDIG